MVEGLKRAWYRAEQFWRALRAEALPATAFAEIAALLTPAELALFQQFDAGEQTHSYAVLQTLRRAGHTQPDLLTAALLHDVGKTKSPLTVWDRVVIVIGHKLWPQRAKAWGQGAAQGWQRPFVVKAQHPAWGAEMATAVGSRPRTIYLIRHHQDPLPASPQTEEEQLLAQLQWADDQN